MAGFKLPTKSQVSFIDLEKYGGEGKLAIHPPKVVDSLAFREFIKEMAKKDGIIVKDDKDLEELAKGKYIIESLTHSFETCVFAVEDGVERPITQEEAFSLPEELLEEIVNKINEASNFPLAQNAGKGQK